MAIVGESAEVQEGTLPQRHKKQIEEDAKNVKKGTPPPTGGVGDYQPTPYGHPDKVDPLLPGTDD